MIPDHSVDLILTDPPYFDNIAYSELADFFLPWLQAFGLVPQSNTSASALPPNLAARSRGAQGYAVFRAGLAACFVEMRRVLRNGGRLIFSFQHQTPKVWEALASALGKSCGVRSRSSRCLATAPPACTSMTQPSRGMSLSVARDVSVLVTAFGSGRDRRSPAARAGLDKAARQAGAHTIS